MGKVISEIRRYSWAGLKVVSCVAHVKYNSRDIKSKMTDFFTRRLWQSAEESLMSCSSLPLPHCPWTLERRAGFWSSVFVARFLCLPSVIAPWHGPLSPPVPRDGVSPRGVPPQGCEARAPQRWTVAAHGGPCVWWRASRTSLSAPAVRLMFGSASPAAPEQSGFFGDGVLPPADPWCAGREPLWLFSVTRLISPRAVGPENELLALCSGASTLMLSLQWPGDTCLEGLCAKCPLHLCTRTFRRCIGYYDHTHTHTRTRAQYLLGPSEMVL